MSVLTYDDQEVSNWEAVDALEWRTTVGRTAVTVQ